MSFKSNNVYLQGRINRIDARYGMTKANKEFMTVTFTLDIEGNLIKVESFSMKHKKDGGLLSSFEGLNTLVTEAKCLHKTIKDIGDEEAQVVTDDTIVENIEDADALDCGNYGIRYTRFTENAYAREGNLVKNIRLECTYPRRVDEEKKEYQPKHEFAITGVLIAPAVLLEDAEGNEKVKLTVTIPTLQEAWGDRPESVTLHDVTVETRDPQAFDYVLDNFSEKGTFVYLEGEIFREVKRVELESAVDDMGRGFGKTKHNKDVQYRTEIDEAFIVEAGYPLEAEEVEDMKEMNMELWSVAKKDKELKEQEMIEGSNVSTPKEKGFGRGETKQPKKGGVLPF